MVRPPAEDLGRYRWHVGAAVTRLEGAAPPLLRDLGLHATIALLDGRLRRLSGRSPVVYLRTAAFTEPYTDHESIGRMLLLRPDLIEPWATGLPHVYVASVRHRPETGLVAFVPGDGAMGAVCERIAGVRSEGELRESLGGTIYDEQRSETLARLREVARDLEETERHAEPLRRALQSGSPREREALARCMERLEVSESDLCSAWHHLPRERRSHLARVLPSASLEGA